MQSVCSIGVPGFQSPDCGTPKPRQGGIKYLIIADIEIEDAGFATPISDLTDSLQWQAALDAGNVEVIGPIMGDVPQATPNTQRVSSCSPAKPISYNRILNLQDFETTKDNTSFYNDAVGNSLGFKWCYVDCENQVYGFISDGTLDVSRIIEAENDTGAQKWQGTFGYIKLEEEVPVAFPQDIAWS